MIKKIFIVALFTIFALNVVSQKITISGTLTDKATGETLLYATVYVEELKTGVTSNEYGFYSLTLPKGNYKFVFSYMGYQPKSVKINLDKSQKFNIELESSSLKLENIEISAKRKDKNVTRNEIGVVELSMKEAKSIPVLLGEQDIIKTMQLLPGINSSSEGGGGFHVRGGSIDQNLILLDEAAVFNASHLMGFFSVFNSDAIKDMKMYKGGIPAQYGGRSSSVLDLRMKEGNLKKYSISGGIGLISSRLTAEGPFQKDKGSFIVSGRRTYFDLFFGLSNDESIQKSTFYFYDLNIKANYKFNDNNRLFVSGYFGRDVIKYEDSFGFDWGNVTGTIRFNHLFSNRFFSNTTLIYSTYDYKFLINNGPFDMDLLSGVEDRGIKQDFTYFINSDNKLRFGLQSSHRYFKPGKFTYVFDGQESGIQIPNSRALESAAYLLNEQNIGARLKLNYGLRFSTFNVLGGKDFYTYNEEKDPIKLEKNYGKTDVLKTFYGVEPRINSTFLLTNESSLKASYGVIYQYLHLMSNTTSGSPTDYWIPSSNNVKPQYSHQYSIGYFQNFKDNLYELSFETYYKDIHRMIEYADGGQIFLNEHVEADLEFGKGRAYGLEFMFRKNSGRFNGWLSYTLSKTEKKFENINKNTWFPAKYDNTHDVSIVAMYKLSNKWNLSATWVYKTGNAVTFPVEVYKVDGVIAKGYTERNGYRMPNYHRLDLGATMQIVENKKYKSELTFSLYNAYGRENAYSIEFRENTDTKNNEAVKIALFKFVPSITWNFKF